MKIRAAAKGRSLFRLAAAALLLALVFAPQIAAADAAGYPETRDRVLGFSEQVGDLVEGPLSRLSQSGYRLSYDENVVGSLLVPGNGEFIGPRLRGGGTTLAKPGDDLFVGTHGKSYNANADIAKRQGLRTSEFTPHHAAQNAVAPTTHYRGITINMRKELHKLTRTWRNPKVDRSLHLRTHLARDVRNIRRILLDAGYDPVVVRTQLWEMIRQNKQVWGP